MDVVFDAAAIACIICYNQEAALDVYLSCLELTSSTTTNVYFSWWFASFKTSDNHEGDDSFWPLINSSTRTNTTQSSSFITSG